MLPWSKSGRAPAESFLLRLNTYTALMMSLSCSKKRMANGSLAGLDMLHYKWSNCERQWYDAIGFPGKAMFPSTFSYRIHRVLLLLVLAAGNNLLTASIAEEPFILEGK